MDTKITISDVLNFASRTNNQAACYFLRFYGVENFVGTTNQYMTLMNQLQSTEHKQVKNHLEKCK